MKLLFYVFFSIFGHWLAEFWQLCIDSKKANYNCDDCLAWYCKLRNNDQQCNYCKKKLDQLKQ